MKGKSGFQSWFGSWTRNIPDILEDTLPVIVSLQVKEPSSASMRKKILKELYWYNHQAQNARNERSGNRKYV